MRAMRTAVFLLLLPAAAYAQNLTGTGASVADSSGQARDTFSSGETITLRQQVNINATTQNSVAFTFDVLSPAGTVVFSQTGNAAPGTAGGAQSQLSGISISRFYNQPGSYTFRGKASLGTESVTQTASFIISSPNIILVYPPYGARGLSDNPLTFRWASSGATRYRLTVADNAGLYNAPYSAVDSGENFASYPEDPTDPRQKLVPDQVYYWKIEGLDAAGNVISESNVYNFSMGSATASLTRDVAVTRLDLASPAMDLSKPLSFSASLSDMGSSPEADVSVSFSLGGLPAGDSPKRVISLAPGQTVQLDFSAFMPPGQEQALAVACADLFDDSMNDNCKTLLVGNNPGAQQPAGGSGAQLSYDEIFQAILKRLGPDAAKSLQGYTFESLGCDNCTQGELQQVIAALVSGDAQLVSASVADAGAGTETPEATAPQAKTAAAGEQSGEAPSGETSFDLEPVNASVPGEWSSYTGPQGKKISTFVIRNAKQWAEVWGKISSEEVPKVDFGKSMIVGVISGSEDRTAAVRLLGQRRTDYGIAFDYYQIAAPAGASAARVPYIFRVYKRSDEKASLSRLDVGD